MKRSSNCWMHMPPTGSLLTDEAAATLPAVFARIDERLLREAGPAVSTLRAGLYDREQIEHLYLGVARMEESVTYQAILS